MNVNAFKEQKLNMKSNLIVTSANKNSMLNTKAFLMGKFDGLQIK